MNPTTTPTRAQLGAQILQDMETSGGDPRDLGPSQATSLRALFENPRTGLFLFATMICGFKDLKTSLHLPVCQLLSRWGESVLEDGSIIHHPPTESDGPIVDSYRRLMIRIPREMFKTSLCTRANPLWQLARAPGHNLTFGVFNAKADNVEKWVGAIAEIVERSRLFQILWSEMIPRGITYEDRERGVTRSRSLKWGEKGILFERDTYGIAELSIEPHGIGAEVAGKHFTHKILDDIIGKEARYSQATMQQAIDWVANSRPLERPAENGCELVAHTPWGYFDVYAFMLQHWPDEYKLYVRHILEDAQGQPDMVVGKSIFPEKISTAKAKQLLKTDPEINLAQYMCLPRPSGDQSFSEEWFRFGAIQTSGGDLAFKIDPEFFDPELKDQDLLDPAPQFIPLSWMDKCLILDPAPSKPNEIKADPRANNAFVAVGVDPWRRRFALDSWKGREGPVEILHRAMAMCDRWGIRRIAIEEVVFSAVYAPLFENIIRHEYDWMPDFIVCKPLGRNKDDRIKSNLIGWMSAGYWYFNHEGTGYLRQELFEFPTGQTKDLPDALSYTDECCQPLESPDETSRRWYDRRTLEVGRGPTGYGQFFTEAG